MADIFISYAHLDNDPSDLESQWIDTFRNELERALKRYLGRSPSIWRDIERLRGNDDLKQKIFGELEEVLVLLPLLSPSYFGSTWCPDEFDHFVSEARPHPPLGIRDRVFKVLLQPEDRMGAAGLPRVLENKLGYEFFKRGPSGSIGDDPWDFKEIGPSNQEFLERLTDLAKDVCRILKSGVGPSKGTVYISRPTIDIDARYRKVVREWTEQGYEVVPNPQLRLPDRRDAFEQVVNEFLESSILSIHLFGKSGKDEGDAAGFSRLQVEYELAKQKCAAGSLHSLVWAPVELQIDDEDQRSFISREVEGREIPRNLEIVRLDFPVFLDAIKQKIESLVKQRSTANQPQDPQENEPAATVYLVYDKCDRGDPHRREIVACLRQQELEILTPASDGEGTGISEILEDHRRNLREAGGVLVFCGAGSTRWLDTQKREIMKLCLRKEQAVCFYLAPPETDYKKFDFAPPMRASFIQQYGPFDASGLRTFITSVQTGASS